MNQLGGVGKGHSMFGGQWNRADGVHYKQNETNPFSYLLDNSLPDLITLTQFTQIVTVYGNKKSIPIVQSNIEPFFIFLLPYFGIGNKLSKKKIASYDISKEKMLTLLKSKGIYPRVGNSSGCFKGGCPKDKEGQDGSSGKLCNCATDWFGTTWCVGYCDGTSCKPMDIPWVCW